MGVPVSIITQVKKIKDIQFRKRKKMFLFVDEMTWQWFYKQIKIPGTNQWVQQDYREHYLH